MSYVKSLKDVLQEKDKALYNRLEEIEKQARNVLQYAQAKFPYYTPHGFLHSENVLENLNWLLSEELKMELNAHELFFLIVSSWLHDWGLVGEPHEKPEEIRENHHLRTEEKFEKLHSLIGVHLNEARIIGRLCRGHRKENLYDDKYEDTPFEAGIIIHRRFLAAALRIADEIDVAANRVPEIIYYDLNPIEKAEEEFKKQMNIIGIAYPSEREKFKLVLSAIAWDPLGVVALKKLSSKIQEELNHVKTILANGVNGKGVMLDYIELRIDTRGFMKDSIEFKIDRKRILNLLIGRSLYSRSDVAIRELVQNSIDACRLRRTVEGDYPAEIEVIQNEKEIIIEDNGIGMDFTTAKNYLSLIGSSYYLSDEFKKLVSEAKGFDPISRWGLGVLAAFLISSCVVIETKRPDAQPCRFIISDVDKGWRYELGSISETGTKVTLSLNEKGRKIDVEAALNYYVKISEFPVFIQRNGERKSFKPVWNLETEIQNRIEDPELEEDLKRHIEKYGKPEIGFEYHTEDEEFDATFYGIEWEGSIYAFFREKFKTCIQGIKTQIPSEYQPFRYSMVILLNIKKNIIDYAVSRERLVANEKLSSLVNKVFLSYVDNVRRDFEQKEHTKKLDGFERSFEWMKFFSSRVDRSIDRYEHSQLQEILLNMPTAKLSCEGLTFDKVRLILERKPSKALHFDFRNYLHSDFQTLMRAIEDACALVQDFLKEGEVAFFSLFPERSWNEAFRLLLSERGITYETADLKVYAIKSSKKVSTPIDRILPQGCHFAEFPKEYDATVIEKRGFSRNDTSDTDMLSRIYRVGPIFLFEDLPDILEMHPGRWRIRDIAKDVITFGEYLINVQKELPKMLISNVDRVLSDEFLLLAAKAAIRSMVFKEVGELSSIEWGYATGLYTGFVRLIEHSVGKTCARDERATL